MGVVRDVLGRRNRAKNDSKYRDKPCVLSHSANLGFHGMPLAYALEQRVMLDAALVDTAAEVLEATATAPIDATESSVNDGLDADLVAALTAPATQEVVFIDSAVAGYQVLVDAVGEGREVVVLDANRDGLQQIAEYLDGRTGVDAIHIVAHGSQGEKTIGSAVLNADSLGAYADTLARIGGSLGAGGDILLYGCSVAQGEAGRTFIEDISRLTQADVAASDNATGSSAYGGDWVLESSVGVIEAETLEAALFGDVLGTWSGTINFDFDGGSVTAGPGTTLAYTVGQATLVAISGDYVSIDTLFDSLYFGRYSNLDRSNSTCNIIKFSDDASFNITSMSILNLSFGQITVRILGYNGETLVGSVQASPADMATNTVDLSAFSAVTRLVIEKVAGSDMVGMNIGVDNLVISNLVVPNLTPINTVPDDQYAVEDTPLVFSAANGNALSIADDSGAVTTTLTVGSGNGTLWVATGGGATIGTNGTHTVTIAGSVAQVNAALASVSYTSAANATGAVNLTMNTTDGDLSNTDSVFIIVRNAPDVTGITRVGNATTNAATVQYTVIFDEAVTGVNSGDFSVATTGSISGASVGAVTGSGTTWTVNVNTGTGDGTIGLNLVDDNSIVSPLYGIALTGNGTANGAFTGQLYTIDKTAPSVPAAPDLILASDTGRSTGDNITSVTTPTLNGVVEANASVAILRDGGWMQTVLADGSGAWSYTSPELDDGTYVFTVMAADAVGNISAASAGTSVTIDSTAPSALAAPALHAMSDSGASNSDGITSDTTPTFTGAAEPTARVLLYANGVLAGSTIANGAGTWQITPPPMTAGTYSFTVKAEDVAGNRTPLSAGTLVTIDITPPSKPAAPDMVSASDSGSSNTDNTTNLTTPTFTGTAEVGSTVIIVMTKDGEAFTANPATAPTTDGAWSWTPAVALLQGNYTIAVKALDLAANTSLASDALSFTIDTTAPTVTANNISVSGGTGTDGAFKIGDVVTASWNNSATGDDNENIASVRMDFSAFGGGSAVVPTYSAGVWQATCTIVAGVLDGVANSNVTVIATDIAGNVATVTDDGDVTVDNQAPLAATGALAVSEMAANATSVGAVSASGAASYALIDSAGGRFAINPSTGVVTVANGSLLDFEASSSHAITVRSTDTVGNTTDTVLSVTVNDSNDAPTLTNGATHALTGTNEDTASSGTLVSAVLAGVGHGDVDAGSVSGLAVTAVTGSGVWQYSTDAGGTWTAFPAVSASSALLLTSTAQVRYVPSDLNGETATFNFRAWDQTAGSTDTTLNGAGTAFSTNIASASIVVTDVNDAPTTASGPYTFTGTTEDTASSGTTVATVLAGVGYGDVDNGALSGLAVTGVTGNGTWQYSPDGSSWTAFPAVSADGALLLSSTHQIRYVPDGLNGETATVSFRAWDRTTGVAETIVSTATNGLTSAFSTSIASASITVTDVNDAPVLTATTPSLTATDIDTTRSALVSAFLATSDVDTGASSGMAVMGSTGSGAWQYSLDGTTWTAFGAASDAAAILLRPTDHVRYVPDGATAETATLIFRAWDQTSGTAGSTVNISSFGGTTPFSANTAMASLLVADLNDAPVLTGGNPSAAPITEDAAPVAITVGSFLSATDVDVAPLSGVAVIGAVGNGTWEYSTDSGATWADFGILSSTQALLLGSTDQVRYAGDGRNGETATFTYRAWDQTSGTAGATADASTVGGRTAFSATTLAFQQTVINVNDAPVLTALTPSLGSTTEDAARTVTVSDFLASTDVDGGAVSGIAVSGATGNGTWAYSLDGGATWVSFPAVTATAALLLTPTDSVRYTPDGANAETAALTYRAWDRSAGAAGGTADTSTNGGSTAFSAASGTASLSVTGLNDAPVLTSGAYVFTSTSEDAATVGVPVSAIATLSDVDAGAVGGIAVTAAAGNGTWQYSTDSGATWAAFGTVSASHALLLGSTDTVRYLPDGRNGEAASLSFRGWDQTSGSVGQKVDTATTGGTSAFSTASQNASLTVTAVNDAPVLIDGTTLTLDGVEAGAVTGSHSVAALLGLVGHGDIDTGASSGIAVMLATGSGAWQYSTDGVIWQAFGPVDDTQALLLGATVEIRYQSVGAETAAMTFRAWDGSTGVEGTKVAVTTTGGSTAFSTETAALDVAVAARPEFVPVNTRSTFTSPPVPVLPRPFHFADVNFGPGFGTGTIGDGMQNNGRLTGVHNSLNPHAGIEMLTIVRNAVTNNGLMLNRFYGSNTWTSSFGGQPFGSGMRLTLGHRLSHSTLNGLLEERIQEGQPDPAPADMAGPELTSLDDLIEPASKPVAESGRTGFARQLAAAAGEAGAETARLAEALSRLQSGMAA